MLKLVSGVVIGVFVGAAAFEFLSRRNPMLLRSIEEKARRAVQVAVDAFEQGYRSRKGNDIGAGRT